MNMKQGGCRGGRCIGGLTEMLQEVYCWWIGVTDASGDYCRPRMDWWVLFGAGHLICSVLNCTIL